MIVELYDEYPASPLERDLWILERRPARNTVDPWRPYSFFVEEERSATGEIVPVAVIFLSNRECPWHCLMCDLWKNTLTQATPLGAIPAQIDYALERVSPGREIKLYNSGSFFDRGAIPFSDHPAIADRVANFDRVIVESHPALITSDCFRFRDLLSPRLEVAMGLETAHPEILARLNKGITLHQFAKSAEKLRNDDIDLRVFILVNPPFMATEEMLGWATKSLDFAFECGATAATLILTRSGNGAVETLSSNPCLKQSTFKTLERAAAYGLSAHQNRVFVDLWDFGATFGCSECHGKRLARLREMNLSQIVSEEILCRSCGVSD